MKKVKENILKFKESDFFKKISVYTLIFVFLSIFILSIYYKYRRSFIYFSDGVRNHMVNLTYFRELLVNFIRTGHISTFSWYTGNGLDLFSNMAWCIFGDFFSYLSIFVRTKDIFVLYNILVFLRIYCIGLSFLCYAKHRKLNNVTSIIGALLYSFSSYVLYAAFRHPYFMNALIIFPLLMIGIEKIIIEDKKVFYTLIVALAFIVNFYFAYSMALVLAIYGTILAINTYKKEGIKKIIKVLLKTLLYSLLGIMISSFILLPTVVDFLNSSRTSGNIPSSYTVTYYRKLVNSLIHLKNTGNWVVIGTQSLIFITLPLTIYKNRKENKSMLFLLLILLLPLLFAPIGSIFMGFNYPNNRWTYVISFIFAFISASFLNNENSITKKDLLIVFISIIVYFFLNAIMENNLSRYFEIQILLLFVWLTVLYFKDFLKKIFKKVNLYNLSLLLILSIGIATSIKFIYDIDGNTYVSSFVGRSEYKKIVNTAYNTIPDFNSAIDYVKEYDKDFYKISRNPHDHQDISLLRKFNSVGYYWSIAPSSLAEISTDLNNSKYHFVRGDFEFDYRTKIDTLMGIKYYINYNNGIVPYGYKKIDGYNGKSTIYENEYFLPFGTLYTNYITEDEYNNLTSLEKESSLLKATVLNDNYKLNHLNNDYSSSIKEVSYNIVDEKNILNNKEIVITESKNNSFEIEIGNVKNSELYLSIQNLNYIPYTKEEMIDLNIDEDSSNITIAEVKQKYKWYQPSTEYTITAKYNGLKKSKTEEDFYTSPYRSNLTEALLNFGYYDETSGTMKITLSSIGKYTFDDIKVYAVSMDDYENDINNLRKSNFKATDWNSGYLKGKVDAEEDGILQFQTVYSKGWKVYVDGQKVNTLTSNKYFLGIEITKGEHDIYLEYHTPYLKEGIIISLLGALTFTTLILVNKRKKGKNKKI